MPTFEEPPDNEAPAQLQALLDQLLAPFEPLDVSMLDGYLCAVLLQPKPVAQPQWLPAVYDLQGRPPPPGLLADRIAEAAVARHAQLARAIEHRDWFDPWIYELEDNASPSDAVLPWVGGFALAMDLFPALQDLDAPELLEPLALLYRHFDPEDLEDADALLTQIDELEPPRDLGEAVEDVVRSVMLIADVSRPVRRNVARPRRR